MATSNRSHVVGVFHDRAKAQEAVRALRAAGFREDQIGVVSQGDEKIHGAEATMGSNAAKGAAIGAGTVGGIAALWSLGITFSVLPVIGPILAAGPIAAALISGAAGAAAGSLVGALAGLGLPEHEAKYYEGEVHSGRTLVTVTAESRYDEVWSILQRFGAYNHATASTTTANTARPAGGSVRMAEGGEKIKVHEEQLHVSKTPVAAGEVRVHKEVHTEHQTINVPVQREEIVIERHAASGRASTSDLREGQEIRIPVKEEKVHVTKEAVVTEEVSVGKRKVTDYEQVSGSVRKEEVKVEQTGDVKVHGDKGDAKKKS